MGHSEPDRPDGLPSRPVSYGATLAPWRWGAGDPPSRSPRRRDLARSPPASRDRPHRPRRTYGRRHPGWGRGRRVRLTHRLCWACTTSGRTSSPTVAAALRGAAHLRLGRSGRVFRGPGPRVIEQRVLGADAFRRWTLVNRFGGPAPGPAPADAGVPRPPRSGRTIRLGIPSGQSSTRARPDRLPGAGRADAPRTRLSARLNSPGPR